MIRSLNTGVLGIRNFQTALDAIGNNLANINTVGYKAARVDFATTLALTLRAPTPDTATVSGRAGMQLGNGVQVSAIKNDFTQGAIKQTGVKTDMAITGDGFFVVKDPTTNEIYATRAGDFREDKYGFLVTNDGYRVQGLHKQAPAFTAAERAEIGDIKLDVGQYTLDRTSLTIGAHDRLYKVGHGYTTGNQVKFFGTLPPLSSGTITDSTTYFVANVDDNYFTIHTNAADAASGSNAVNFTNATTGIAIAGSSVAGVSASVIRVGVTGNVTQVAESTGISIDNGNSVVVKAGHGFSAGQAITFTQKNVTGISHTIGTVSGHVVDGDSTPTSTITKATHGYDTGQAIVFSGSVPTGASVGAVYYAGNNATNTFTLHSSRANAVAGTDALTFTSDGSFDMVTGTTFTKTAHGYVNGEVAKFTGTPPAGLDLTTALFVKKIDNNSFTLHASKADALSGANKLGYTDTAASASLNGVLPGGNLNDTLYVGNASTNNFTLHSTRAAAEAGTGAIAPSSAVTANYRLDTGTTISKTAHGYTTGESVKFNGTAPDGLDTSTVYFVRAVDANNITLHKTPEDATADTNKLSFSNTGSLSLDSGLDLRKAAHGFATGDTVRFNTTAPDGASTTTTYHVRSLSASAFTLHTTAADANNNANIKSFSSGGTFNLDKGSVLTKTAHGLTTGEGVNFTSTAPGNTTSTGTYYVNVTDANNFTIHSSTADAATATNAIVFNTTGAAYSVDGNVAGDNSYSLAGGASIASYSVGADGKVNMLLTDGTQYVRGQMMLQNFKNPQALMKQGANLFGNLATAGPIGSEGLSVGATDILKNSKAPGSFGVGRIAAGALELANVDMAREFSNMITTQRAFQANARMITTSDEILKEMMALKR